MITGGATYGGMAAGRIPAHFFLITRRKFRARQAPQSAPFPEIRPGRWSCWCRLRRLMISSIGVGGVPIAVLTACEAGGRRGAVAGQWAIAILAWCGLYPRRTSRPHLTYSNGRPIQKVIPGPWGTEKSGHYIRSIMAVIEMMPNAVAPIAVAHLQRKLLTKASLGFGSFLRHELLLCWQAVVNTKLA